MTFNLATMARRQGKRRDVTLRPINPPVALATDLAAIYAPAWRIWQEGVDAIMAGYDPVPLGDALTTDTADQIQAAIASLASDFLTRLVTIITPNLTRWAVAAERVHRHRWVNAVKAGTGVDLDTFLTAQPVQETLANFIQRNVALVTNVSDQAKSRISDAVFRGYQERRPAREVAAEIREAAAMGRDRAIRIASHQNSALSSALDAERQVEAGLEIFRYRHGAKKHPRPKHLARDGKLFYIVSGREVDGGDEIAAGDGPGEPPFCSCRRQAYLRLMEEFGL